MRHFSVQIKIYLSRLCCQGLLLFISRFHANKCKIFPVETIHHLLDTFLLKLHEGGGELWVDSPPINSTTVITAIPPFAAARTKRRCTSTGTCCAPWLLPRGQNSIPLEAGEEELCHWLGDQVQLDMLTVSLDHFNCMCQGGFQWLW